ncbi:MAG: thiamine diphosphokinase [Chloroflexota bacterium]
MRKPEGAIIVLDGLAPTRAELNAAWPGWDPGADLVIAADGGARLADSLGLTIRQWVGDGDSLGPDGVAELRARGLDIELAPVDKDASDAELAVLAAVDSGAQRIVIIGALGGSRPDHALANVALLSHPALAGHQVEILDAAARIRLAIGVVGAGGASPTRIDLSGRLGDVVSLIPLESASGVTTHGLKFSLNHERLEVGPSRGLSNVRFLPDAWLTIEEGRVLVVECPATLLS